MFAYEKGLFEPEIKPKSFKSKNITLFQNYFILISLGNTSYFIATVMVNYITKKHKLSIDT